MTAVVAVAMSGIDSLIGPARLDPLISMDPVTEPGDEGVTLTWMVQLPPASSIAGQSLVCANGLLAVIVLISAGKFPEFVNMTGTELLELFTGTDPKSTSVVLVDNLPAWPMPLSDTEKLTGLKKTGVMGT